MNKTSLLKRLAFYRYPGFMISVFLLVLLAPISPSLLGQESESNESVPTFKESVKVLIQSVPFYAMDSDGKPVFDLKREEIEFYINNKRIKKLAISGYRFSGKAQPNQTADSMKHPPERYVFIIFDKIFNSISGTKQSKLIVPEILAQSSPGDSFIFLEMDKYNGLRYRAGPTKNRKILQSFLDTIDNVSGAKVQLSNISSAVLRKRGPRLSNMKAGGASAEADLRIRMAAMSEMGNEMSRYSQKGKTFTHALAALKFALKTITRPKLIYLVSEGMKHGYIRSRDKGFYFEQFKHAAQAVNHGGCMFFVMDSSKIPLSPATGISGKQTLKYLAENSGGKYFSGRDYKEMVRQLQNTTAAYYELLFSQDLIRKKKRSVKLNLKCLRKGVTLHVINRTEFKVPYRDMEEKQKKLFALDIVNRGSWSRMVSQLGKIQYRIDTHRKQNKVVEVILPKALKNKMLDLYVVNVHPKTFNSRINFVQKRCPEKAVLDIHVKKNWHQYFVLIEPDQVVALYNRVM